MSQFRSHEIIFLDSNWTKIIIWGRSEVNSQNQRAGREILCLELALHREISMRDYCYGIVNLFLVLPTDEIMLFLKPLFFKGIKSPRRLIN